MTSTFLHEEKIVAPDEQVDGAPLRCELCDRPLWLVNWTRRATDAGDLAVRSYECKSCGHNAEIATKIPLAG
jgi:hypothetical protein